MQNVVSLMMRTHVRRLAPRTCLALLVAAIAAACGGGGLNTGAAHSPSPAAASSASPSAAAFPSPQPSGSPHVSASPQGSPAQTPVAVTGAYGVLVAPPASNSYAVSLIGIDGKVVASAQASSPATVTCANTAAAVVPQPVSTSNTRVYFMDAQGVIRFLAPSGDTGRATTVPVGSARRSMFAVSPDDKRIAVVVADFVQSGAATQLYVEDLNGGGNHINLFSETGAYTLWPIGWHSSNNLVVAKVPSCTQGGGPFCCGPQELHVVDPATADRRFTLGSPTCVVAGAPSPAGVLCENTSFTAASVVDWTAGVSRTIQIQGAEPAYLSPDGREVALVTTSFTDLDPISIRRMEMNACGWIDSRHLLAGGDVQNQARVGDILAGTTVPVAAFGQCAGRVPGGL